MVCTFLFPSLFLLVILTRVYNCVHARTHTCALSHTLSYLCAVLSTAMQYNNICVQYGVPYPNMYATTITVDDKAYSSTMDGKPESAIEFNNAQVRHTIKSQISAASAHPAPPLSHTHMCELGLSCGLSLRLFLSLSLSLSLPLSLSLCVTRMLAG